MIVMENKINIGVKSKWAVSECASTSNQAPRAKSALMQTPAGFACRACGELLRKSQAPVNSKGKVSWPFFICQ